MNSVPVNETSSVAKVDPTGGINHPPTASSLMGSPSAPTAATPAATVTRLRSFKSTSTNKWVAREIAALEFLSEIPMAAEGAIVQEGWLKQEQRQQEMHHNRSNSYNSLVVMMASQEEDNPQNNDNGGHISPDAQPPVLTRHGRWWEKWITSSLEPHNQRHVQNNNDIHLDRDSRIEDLEEPEDSFNNHTTNNIASSHGPSKPQQQQVVPTAVVPAPGRRLEGDIAIKVQVPLSADVSVQTRQRTIARIATEKEWELRVAHGILPGGATVTSASNRKVRQPEEAAQPPLLDGRLFFSAKESYPIQVSSLLRYEPKREEAARRRQKLEERGGGGTQFFILPSRDWRGISYRALLPMKEHRLWNSRGDAAYRIITSYDNEGEGKLKPSHNKKKEKNAAILFDRFASRSEDAVQTPAKSETDSIDRMKTPKKYDEETDDESDSDDDDPYVAGLLDDPNMVLGRHRNVMIGDRGTGPIVSSTIQFVKPQLLKGELNKQFRDRFDGYEPHESQRKYIGARVIDGVYTLIDPTEDNGASAKEDDSTAGTTTTTGTSIVPPVRKRQGSLSSFSSTNAGGGTKDAQETIRMPPSLTLSKIRSLKVQALMAAIKAKLEISTVALAIVYFERLCLDCRVDKSNRRLSFAACLLIAVKINEDLKALGKQEKIEQSPSNSLKPIPSIRFQSLIRPTKKVDSLFASLLAFFTQDWNISLKHLFAAEWGVFAGLQFRLNAKPSHVAFHFKLLMKSLGWDPLRYLGIQMYGNWQKVLAEEEFHRQEREQRIEKQRHRKEQKKLMQLERELEAANRKEKSSRSSTSGNVEKQNNGVEIRTSTVSAVPLKNDSAETEKETLPATKRGSRHGLGDIFKLPLGGKRSHSTERQWRNKHDSSHQKDLQSTARSEVLVEPKPSSSPEIRPLSKSVSMFARTSLERDLAGADIALHDDGSGEDLGHDPNSTVAEDGILI